jgi:hypothetical protein
VDAIMHATLERKTQRVVIAVAVLKPAALIRDRAVIELDISSHVSANEIPTGSWSGAQRANLAC